MIYPSIDVLLSKMGSKYLLVNIVARRSKELHEKKNYQMQERQYRSHKNIGRSLEEVTNNLIHLK